jgi:hypothetical protein
MNRNSSIMPQIDFFAQTKDQAKEIGFRDTTISVANSYANALLELRLDLINVAAVDQVGLPTIAIYGRAGESTIKILIQKQPADDQDISLFSFQYLISISRMQNNGEWSYRTSAPEMLIHFSSLVKGLPGLMDGL